MIHSFFNLIIKFYKINTNYAMENLEEFIKIPLNLLQSVLETAIIAEKEQKNKFFFK